MLSDLFRFLFKIPLNPKETHCKMFKYSTSIKSVVQILPTSRRFHPLLIWMNELEFVTIFFPYYMFYNYFFSPYHVFIEEVVTKKKTELTTTRQIETRVKRQIVLEDGKVVEDSGPIVETNTTEDTNKQESESVEVNAHMMIT